MTGLTPDVIRAFATARRWADLNRGLDVSERQLWQLAHMLAEAEPRARDREVRQRGPRRSGLRPGAGWGGKAAARPPDGLKPGPGSTETSGASSGLLGASEGVAPGAAGEAPTAGGPRSRAGTPPDGRTGAPRPSGPTDPPEAVRGPSTPFRPERSH